MAGPSHIWDRYYEVGEGVPEDPHVSLGWAKHSGAWSNEQHCLLPMSQRASLLQRADGHSKHDGWSWLGDTDIDFQASPRFCS